MTTKYRNIDHAERLQSRHERNMFLSSIAAAAWFTALYTFLSMPSGHGIGPTYGFIVYVICNVMSVGSFVFFVFSYFQVKRIDKYLNDLAQEISIIKKKAFPNADKPSVE